MDFSVKIDDEVLYGVTRAIEQSDEEVAATIAEVAYFHANFVLGNVPEAVKGKLSVHVASNGADEVVISYQPKAGAEGSTLTREKIFLPMSKLGGSTTRKPAVSRSGEQGLFISGLKLTGRPSIDAYLMNNVENLLVSADELTAELAAEQVTADLKRWFEHNGVVFNSGAGRYQATKAVTLPTGGDVRAGSFIVGDF